MVADGSEREVLAGPVVVMLKTPLLARGGNAARLAASGRRVAAGVAPAAAEHDRTLDAVLASLARHGVEPLLTGTAPDATAARTLARASLVVSVGGDGTLLAASHHVTAGALLGVNSAPRDSVGQFALARRTTVARLVDAIADGRLRPLAVTRMTTRLDGTTLPTLALNDVLVAHEHPAATSRYLLRHGRVAEAQRSSGLWIATAAGSTAGIRSSGGTVMPLRSRRLQFRARELLRSPLHRPRLGHGFLDPGATLVVESQMEAGWLFLDGSRIGHRFPFGARAELRAAPAPLRLYADPARWR